MLATPGGSAPWRRRGTRPTSLRGSIRKACCGAAAAAGRCPAGRCPGCRRPAVTLPAPAPPAPARPPPAATRRTAPPAPRDRGRRGRRRSRARNRNGPGLRPLQLQHRRGARSHTTAPTAPQRRPAAQTRRLAVASRAQHRPRNSHRACNGPSQRRQTRLRRRARGVDGARRRPWCGGRWRGRGAASGGPPACARPGTARSGLRPLPRRAPACCSMGTARTRAWGLLDPPPASPAAAAAAP
mmetsp:Transcript_114204/g.317712  ORF Transcript_114204/g.317712 Transcript_114204/m.317712 type:complete len:241 (-) Transcript_114204:407-1129(-)